MQICQFAGVSARIEPGCGLGHEHCIPDQLMPFYPIVLQPSTSLIALLGSIHIVEASTVAGSAALSVEVRSMKTMTKVQ